MQMMIGFVSWSVLFHFVQRESTDSVNRDGISGSARRRLKPEGELVIRQ
jgi:hypothetical protein